MKPRDTSDYGGLGQCLALAVVAMIDYGVLALLVAALVRLL